MAVESWGVRERENNNGGGEVEEGAELGERNGMHKMSDDGMKKAGESALCHLH